MRPPLPGIYLYVVGDFIFGVNKVILCHRHCKMHRGLVSPNARRRFVVVYHNQTPCWPTQFWRTQLHTVYVHDFSFTIFITLTYTAHITY